MRRPPLALLVLAPLLLALLYALVYRFAAPTPTVETVVPAGAVYVQRYRDIDALNETFFRHPDDPTSPAERISKDLNIPGFPGLDRRRPIHLVFLPRGRLPDSTMYILPLVREEALRAPFEDPDVFLERGNVRHAKYLGVRGDFAAIGRDPDAVEHLGEGGLTAESLGETFVIAIDVPGLVDYAAQTPWQKPWQPIFQALGVSEDDIQFHDGVATLTSDRVARVRNAWRTARLWAFAEEKRIRIELEPSEGPLADALATLAARPADGARADGEILPRPRRAQAWVRAPGALERIILARALYAGGVDLPHEPGGWGDVSKGAGVLLWASASRGKGHAWTLGVAAPRGTLLDLASFLPGAPDLVGPHGDLDADIEVAEGSLPLTLADLTLDRVAPAGRIVAKSADLFDVVRIGSDPEKAWADFERGLAEVQAGTTSDRPPSPWREVARFGLEAARARTLLGNEVKTGGVFAVLRGGDIEGTIWTDGRVLRLDAKVVEPR